MMEEEDWRKESIAEDTKEIRIDSRGGMMVKLPTPLSCSCYKL